MTLTQDTPEIILKFASTLNGVIGNNTQNRLILSNPLDQERVMEIRTQVDAILIGGGTLVKDNPRLTLRPTRSKPPLRIVYLTQALKNHNYNLLTDGEAKTILFTKTTNKNLPKDITQITLPQHNLLNVLKYLKSNLGINKLLIEGGADIIKQILDQDLATKIRILYSPQILTQGVKIFPENNLDMINFRKKIEILGDMFAVNLERKSAN